VSTAVRHQNFGTVVTMQPLLSVVFPNIMLSDVVATTA
jgi:hypothetical protein